MPKLGEQAIKMLDGAAVLFRRNRSSAWQVRYKIGTRWLRTSTKHKDEREARKTAEDIVLEARYRHKLGLPTQSRKFAQLAQQAIQRMKAAQAQGEGKVVYSHYIAALENYLIPFMGNHGITSVDSAMLQRFAVWRGEKLGREPKASTVNTHNAALNRVLELAVELNYLSKTQLPYLVNKARDGSRRPDFTLEEYRQLYRFMRRWIREGKAGKSTQMRELLRDYVLILANTGMRHGTESYNLRWKHVSEFEANQRRYLALWVTGKTGSRELVARHRCVEWFKRIHARAEDLKHLSWDQLMKAGREELVFRLADGTVTKSLHQTFEAMLAEAGLLEDKRTEQNRTLYSLRHTYATFALVRGQVDIHTLAQQMGTSIVMIEKHYSHLRPRQRAETLAGGPVARAGVGQGALVGPATSKASKPKTTKPEAVRLVAQA